MTCYYSHMKPIKQPERLTERIDIRLTKTEHEILKKVANKHKVSRNLLLRHLIQQSIETN